MSCPWQAFSPGTISFCETRLCGWIAEPANTWSNLAYFLIGFYILWNCRGRLRDPLTLVGVTAVLVAIGSTIFHATGTFFGEVLDVSAMYLISGLFIVFGAKRLWPISDRHIWQIYAAIVASAIALLIATRWSGIPVFVLHVTIAVLIEGRLYRQHVRGTINYKPLMLMVSFFVAAFTMWNLDIKLILCNPDNHIFTGHSFWHVANSFCLWFFYKFHRQFSKSYAT